MESIIPIRLAPGNVVRIVRGRGARVTTRRGALWISEEGSLDDHVLMPGDSLTLEHDGKALALAVRSSRATVEIPRGVPPPRVLEMALSDGHPGRRIDVGSAGTAPGWWAIAVVMTALTRAIDAVCSLLLHPDAGAASSRRPGGAGEAGGRQVTIGQRQPGALQARSSVRRNGGKLCWGTR